MPRRGIGTYPPGWKDFAHQLKDESGWTCIRCQHSHDPVSGYTLTVHHVTMDKAEPFAHWWAFLVVCQRCHLQIQHKVILDRPWVMAEHSEWFKPYVAGWYAHRYLGRDVTREEVESNLDWFVNIERSVVLGGATSCVVM